MSIDLKRPDDIQEVDLIFVGRGEYKGEKGERYDIQHKKTSPRFLPGLIRAVASRWKSEGYCLYTVGILQEKYDLFENGGSEFDCHITNCFRYQKTTLCKYWDHEQCNRPEEELETQLPVIVEDFITAETAEAVHAKSRCNNTECKFYRRATSNRCLFAYWQPNRRRCAREGGPLYE